MKIEELSMRIDEVSMRIEKVSMNSEEGSMNSEEGSMRVEDLPGHSSGQEKLIVSGGGGVLRNAERSRANIRALMVRPTA